jgi:hypothetical protein
LAARAQVDEANRQLRASHVDRLVGLAAILSASRLLRLRFLDMFVREIVASKSPQIDAEWRRRYNDIPRPRASDVCSADREGVCFRVFRDLLLGVDNRAGSEPGVQGEANRLISALNVFGPPAPLDKPAATSWAETIEQRFFYGWVELPFRAPNDRAAPPARLLASWITALLNSVVVVDEVSVENGNGEEQYQDQY